MDELFGIDCSEDSPFKEEILKRFLDKRIIVFNDSVDTEVLENIVLHILEWNAADVDIPADKRKPIWIYIQSLGGSTVVGSGLIDIIQISQTPVYTVGFFECASMGFNIFIAGHKRYAFKNTVLMMHDGEIGIQNSTSKAKDTMDFINAMEKRTKEFVISNTNIDSDFYDEIYDREYYMYADDAKKLGCVDYIIGEDVTLNDIIK